MNYDLTKISERWRALEDGLILEDRAGQTYTEAKLHACAAYRSISDPDLVFTAHQAPKPPVTLDEIERRMSAYGVNDSVLIYAPWCGRDPYHRRYHLKNIGVSSLASIAFAISRVEAGAAGWAVEWGDA